MMSYCKSYLLFFYWIFESSKYAVKEYPNIFLPVHVYSLFVLSFARRIIKWRLPRKISLQLFRCEMEVMKSVDHGYINKM